MPRLTWYGHACFRLEAEGAGSVLFDPYERGSVPGIELPDGLSANLVICSHEHGDHNAAERVQDTGQRSAFSVTTMDTWHDDKRGTLRGPNRITVVSHNGFRAAHLGDLGCDLTPGEISILSGVDLLLLPVGGHFTIGPEEAKAILNAVRPRVAVPMHYRRGEMGYPVLHTLEDFTALFPAWTEIQSNVLEIYENTSGLYVLNL